MQAATDRVSRTTKHGLRRRTATRLGRYRVLTGTVLLVLFTALPLTAAIAQEVSTDEELRSEWQRIQSSKERSTHRQWWADLQPDRLDAFLRAGVDVSVSNHRRWTPLHSAARYSARAEVVSQLLTAGADVNAKDRAGDTPLHWAAAENANVKVCETLIEAGANVNAVDRYGWLPIHTAAESNPNPDVLKTLLDAGAKRKRRAYFLLFSPKFLLKHNARLSDADKEQAVEWLESAS